MRLLTIDTEKDGNRVMIKALMDKNEFRLLSGYIENLIVFSAENITVPTKAIKTGARANMARYLLLPVSLRHKCKADDYDFENIRCGAVECDGKLFIVFCLEGKRVINRIAVNQKMK